mmetsp:Transcript_24612/g.34756  ORF Transcript_24612/g.34756 Transcript_24612/m.34756 type:complete len:126 (+) Transcript_24612:283-660(+)
MVAAARRISVLSPRPPPPPPSASFPPTKFGVVEDTATETGPGISSRWPSNRAQSLTVLTIVCETCRKATFGTDKKLAIKKNNGHSSKREVEVTAVDDDDVAEGDEDAGGKDEDEEEDVCWRCIWS